MCLGKGLASPKSATGSKKLSSEAVAAKPTAAVRGQWHNSTEYFKMPLHYPRYTRAQYEAMDEVQLDFLLKEYGLPCNGDVAEKRKDAVGHFLWSDA